MKNKQSPIERPVFFLFLTAAVMLFYFSACIPGSEHTAETLPQPVPTSTVNDPGFTPQPAHTHTPFSALITETAVIPEPPAASSAMATTASEALPFPTENPTTLEVQRTQYYIHASIDYDAHLLSVEENIIYKNRTKEPIDSLTLILMPQLFSAQFELLEIYWPDGTAIEPFTMEAGVLRIPLPAPLLPEETSALGLIFACEIPAGASPFGYTGRQLNLADWYAFAPVYGPDGWMNHKPAAVGEHLVYDLADFNVEIRLSGSRDDILVAAPVPAEADGNIRRYLHRQARNFTLSLSPEYVMLQDPASGIRAYVFPEHTASGAMSIRCVREALDLFTKLFGDPDLEWMNIVEADFPDGMEYDGLFFLNWLYFEYPGAGTQSGLCTLSVHETAHQWWYRMVGSDTAYEPWLDEALCTFSELIFYEQVHPDQVNWWWGYRIHDYQPQGWVNAAIYDYNDYRSYVNAVYLRGALFLDSLRRSAGYAAMLDFLYAYAREYRFSQANAQGFFKLWKETTGLDAGAVIKQYFK